MSRVRRLVAAVADVGPLVALAAIAGAGSFTHIKTTAEQHGQHGWMAWAVAVCIDLMAVMAGRELRRDKKHGRKPNNPFRLSWPLVVLVASIGLSLAANLEQAGPGPWGKVVAAVPAGAFLIAVSLIERRGTHTPTDRSQHPTRSRRGSPSNRPTTRSPNCRRPTPPRSTRPRLPNPRPPLRPRRRCRLRPAGPRLTRCWRSPGAWPRSTAPATAWRSPRPRSGCGCGSPPPSPPTCSANSAHPHPSPRERR